VDLHQPTALANPTETPELPAPRLPTDPPTIAAGSAPARSPAPSRAWWQRPWPLLWGGVAAWFLAISLPHYVGLNRSLTPVRLNPQYPLHYPFLIAHITCGTIALVTACVQVWPWLRENHLAVHRWNGRVFVFAGALPTGLLALAIVPFSQGPVGNATAAILWLATTVAGYRAARQHREAAHRRWMTYSFALTLQIVWGRVMFKVLVHVPGVNLADPHTLGILFETASWIGIVINLLVAQWWLERTPYRPTRQSSR
jgi:hypothetical protein